MEQTGSDHTDEVAARGLSPDARRALQLALGGFAGLIITPVLMAFFRGDSDWPIPTALAVVFVVLGVAAFGAMIAGGFRAAKALRAEPVATTPGRLAVRGAVVLATLLIVMAATFGVLAATDTWEGDSEPFLAAWLVLALTASLVGAFAPEPGRRGLLVFPFLLGTAALVLFVSEMTGLT